MKTKLQFLLIGIITLSLSTQAQKVKNNGIGGLYYLQPPKTLILQDFKSYLVDVPNKMSSDDKKWVAMGIDLTGFKKRNDSADVIVEIKNIGYGHSGLQKKKNETVVERDGKKIKTVKYYYSADIGYNVKVKVYDAENPENIVFKKNYKGVETIQSDEYSTPDNAKNNFNSKFKTFKDRFLKDYAKTISADMNNELCFSRKYYRMRTGTIKERKHKYTDYYEAYENYLKGIELIRQNIKDIHHYSEDLTVLPEAEVYFNKAKPVFEEMLKESDTENKKARINNDVTALLLSNIGNIYFLLRDFEKAKEYFQEASKYHEMIGYSPSMLMYTNKILERYATLASN